MSLGDTRGPFAPGFVRGVPAAEEECDGNGLPRKNIFCALSFASDFWEFIRPVVRGSRYSRSQYPVSAAARCPICRQASWPFLLSRNSRYCNRRFARVPLDG